MLRRIGLVTVIAASEPCSRHDGRRKLEEQLRHVDAHRVDAH